MIKVLCYIVGGIVIYLAVGAAITRINLPLEDRQGITGCSNIIFGMAFWPVVALLVLIVKRKNRKKIK